MFYSKDLLGKKSALGAIWIAAHGKRLNRGRIMQVDVSRTCDHLLNPEVPQALRLQAILVGGVVIVHSRQTTFLLDDCQDTLRRLRAAERPDAEECVLDSVGAKARARAEAITLPESELSRMVGGGLFDLHALRGDAAPPLQRHLNFGPAPPAHGSAQSRGDYAALDDALFLMPSIPDETQEPVPSARGTTRVRDASPAAGQSASLTGATGTALHRAQIEQLDEDEEYFYIPEAELAALQFVGSDAMEEGGGAWAPGGEGPARDLAWDGNQEAGGGLPPVPPRRGGAPPVRRRTAPKVDAAGVTQIPMEAYRAWLRQATCLAGTPPLPRDARACTRRAAVPSSLATTSSLALGPLLGSWSGLHHPVTRILRTATATTSTRVPPGRPALATHEMHDGGAHVARGVQAAWAGGDGGTGYEDPGSRTACTPVQQHSQDRTAGSGPWLQDLARDGTPGWVPGRQALPGMQASSESSEEFDLETERLRAALNVTPNSAGLDALLGVTSKGTTPLPNGGVEGWRPKRRRISSLHPDSVDGALSERSSDGQLRTASGDSRMPAEGSMDFGALLPAVGEAELEGLEDGDSNGSPQSGSERKRRAAVSAPALTQFALVEETMADTQHLSPATQGLAASSVALLRVLGARFGGGSQTVADGLSFTSLASRLRRDEAARLFYQLLGMAWDDRGAMCVVSGVALGPLAEGVKTES